MKDEFNFRLEEKERLPRWPWIDRLAMLWYRAHWHGMQRRPLLERAENEMSVNSTGEEEKRYRYYSDLFWFPDAKYIESCRYVSFERTTVKKTEV